MFGKETFCPKLRVIHNQVVIANGEASFFVKALLVYLRLVLLHVLDHFFHSKTRQKLSINSNRDSETGYI